MKTEEITKKLLEHSDTLQRAGDAFGVVTQQFNTGSIARNKEIMDLTRMNLHSLVDLMLDESDEMIKLQLELNKSKMN